MAVVLNGDGTIIGLHNVVTDDSAEAIAILKADSAVEAYVEDDPVFSSHDASAVTTAKISTWDTAYGWNDHAQAGYLDSAVFDGHAASDVTTTKISNWDTAYGWNDHAQAGYLTTETDPVFTAHAASDVTTTKISNWDTAYSWGDHGTEGYLTSLGDAAGVTSAKISNWDTAYGWGDHGTEGYATTSYVDTAVSNLVDTSPAALDTLNELAAALGDDPNFSTTITTSIGTKWTQDNTKISNWDTAYGWGDHSTEGYSSATYTANISNSGTYQLMFESSGNYFGSSNFTITPTQGVTISGSSNPRLKITNSGAGLRFLQDNSNNWIQSASNVDAAGGGVPLRFSDGQGANTWMVITGSGDVGVGTTSPARELDIKLSDDTTTTLGQKGGINLYAPSNTVGNGGELTWSSGVNSEVWAAISGHITANSSGHASGHLVFATGDATALPSERMRLTNDGNVLIGRTSTANAATDRGIQLYSSGHIYQYVSSTGNSDIHRWYNGSGTKVASIQGDGHLVNTGVYIQRTIDSSPALGMRPVGNYDLEVGNFGGSVSKLTFNSNGYALFDKNVGIGTTSDPYDSAWGTTSRQLAIVGDRYGVVHLESNVTTPTKYSIGAGDGKHYMSYDDNANRHNIVVSSAGDVGIGTSSPVYRLHIVDANSDLNMDANATGQLHIDGNGYGFGIALGLTEAALYTNAASRDVVLGVDETAKFRADASGTVTYGRHLIDGSGALPLIVDAGAAQGAIQYKSNGTIRGYVGNGSYLLTGANASDFIVRSEGYMKLTYDGNNEGLRVGASGARITTATGNVEIGSLNSTYCHYITDRGRHYFNTTVTVNGNFEFYQGNSFNTTDVGNWDTAYGWGDHGTEGYAVKSAANSFTNSYNEFGNATSSVSNDGSWNGRLNVAGTGHAKIEVSNSTDNIKTAIYSHVGQAEGKVGTTSSHKLGLMSSGTTRAQVDSSGITSVGSAGFLTEATNGRGYKFWTTTGNYSLHMSSSVDTSWGGAMAIAPTSDYNIYFRNSTGGTNRGFVFQDSALDTKAQITGDGDLYVKRNIISPNSNRVVAHYRTTSGSTDRVLIETPFVPADNLMTRFTIDLYSAYHKDTYEVSGYAYGSVSNWYLPKCIYRGDNAETPDIIFGKTAGGKLYVSLGANEYLGVNVHSLMVTYNGDDTDYQNTDWSISRSNTVANQISHETNNLSRPYIAADATGNRALVLTSANGNTDPNAMLFKDSGTSLYFNTSNNTLVSPTFSGALSGNASSATLAATLTTAAAGGTWYEILGRTGTSIVRDAAVRLHGSGYVQAVYMNMTHGATDRTTDTVFYSSTDDYIRKTTKSGMLTSLGLPPATGNYGTIKVNDDRGVTYAGFAIRDDWVFMSSGADLAGIYNDTDNEWVMTFNRNAAVNIYHNGISVASTNSTGMAMSALSLTGVGALRESTYRSGILSLSDSGDGWQGFGIEHASAAWQFMGADNNAGIYEDIGNKWYVYCTRNGAVDLYHNNSVKLSTTSTGVSVTGSVSAASAVLANQAAYIAPNYGHGMFGVYSATRYQHVWSMGTSYKTSADGTSPGNMYGLTYTHTNIGTGTNQAISGLSHQLQGRNSGNLHWALGTGIWTSGNITAYSDRAVKTNLEVIPDALAKVKSISGYTYDRTDFVVDEATGEMPDTRQAGVVAQEVEKILPEVVSGEEGNKAVAYGNMVALLIEAVKELSAEVDALKAGK